MVAPRKTSAFTDPDLVCHFAYPDTATGVRASEVETVPFPICP
jgi:hypothetical protein